MRLRTRRLLAASAITFSAYGVGIWADAEGLRRYAALGDDIASLELKNARLRGELETLRRELSALGTDRGALERTARDELGFVRVGEVQVRIEE